jgi:hypothetical protein
MAALPLGGTLSFDRHGKADTIEPCACCLSILNRKIQQIGV